jgi:hypothetical protein
MYKAHSLTAHLVHDGVPRRAPRLTEHLALVRAELHAPAHCPAATAYAPRLHCLFAAMAVGASAATRCHQLHTGRWPKLRWGLACNCAPLMKTYLASTAPKPKLYCSMLQTQHCSTCRSSQPTVHSVDTGMVASGSSPQSAFSTSTFCAAYAELQAQRAQHQTPLVYCSGVVGLKRQNGAGSQ